VPQKKNIYINIYVHIERHPISYTHVNMQGYWKFIKGTAQLIANA